MKRKKLTAKALSVFLKIPSCQHRSTFLPLRSPPLWIGVLKALLLQLLIKVHASSPYWSTVVSIEGAWKIAGHPLTNLSTQQIIDCSRPEGNRACGGGLITQSFQYVLDAGGIESAEDYPYRPDENPKCEFDPKKITARIKSFVVVPSDEQSFTSALAICPVATAIDASGPRFQYYKSGIYNDKCSTEPNHGIGVVGYGENSDGKYYILKNTWTTAWDGGFHVYGERGR